MKNEITQEELKRILDLKEKYKYEEIHSDTNGDSELKICLGLGEREWGEGITDRGKMLIQTITPNGKTDFVPTWEDIKIMVETILRTVIDINYKNKIIRDLRNAIEDAESLYVGRKEQKKQTKLR